jgi:hypothetical protein
MRESPCSSSWPVFVHVARLLREPKHGDTLTREDLEEIGWAVPLSQITITGPRRWREQVPEEGAHFRMLDVLGREQEVEAAARRRGLTESPEITESARAAGGDAGTESVPTARRCAAAPAIQDFVIGGFREGGVAGAVGAARDYFDPRLRSARLER